MERRQVCVLPNSSRHYQKTNQTRRYCSHKLLSWWKLKYIVYIFYVFGRVAVFADEYTKLLNIFPRFYLELLLFSLDFGPCLGIHLIRTRKYSLTFVIFPSLASTFKYLAKLAARVGEARVKRTIYGNLFSN